MTRRKLFELEDLISVLPASVSEAETEQIIKAYGFAEKAHQDRQRESKEKYIEHDIALAVTLTKFAVDANTIMASLLHDILLAHTRQNGETIMIEFGEDVTNLVSALGKLAPYTDKTHPSKDDRTLEATRRAILTIVEGDSRVILIHLADRLEDLRQANNLPSDIRERLALEARDIHAPLANRLGIWQIKWELEDLAFRYLETDQYHRIANRIAERRAERDQRIKVAAEILYIRSIKRCVIRV